MPFTSLIFVINRVFIGAELHTSRYNFYSTAHCTYYGYMYDDVLLAYVYYIIIHLYVQVTL